MAPKIPSNSITKMAKILAPEEKIKEIGTREGEKLHEVLIPEDGSRHTVELDDMFVVQPAHQWWSRDNHWEHGQPLPEGFSFSSDRTDNQLSLDETHKMLEGLA